MLTPHVSRRVSLAVPSISFAACLAAGAGLAAPAAASDGGLLASERFHRPSIYEEPRRSRNPQRGQDIGFELRGWGEHAFETDFRDDDTEGDVEVSRVGGGAEVFFPAGERARISFSYDNEFSFYSFDGVTTLGGDTGVPITDDIDVYDYRIGTSFNGRLTDRLGFRAGASVSFAGESGVSFSDSSLFGGYGAVSYTVTEDFTFGGGAAFSERFIDDVVVIPFAFVDWQITDILALRTKTGFRHVGGELALTALDYLTFTVDSGYERREYRLDEGDLADTTATMRDVRVPVAAGARLHVGPNFDLHLRGGAYVFQEFTFQSENGNGETTSETERTDRNAFISLNAELQW